MKKIKRAVKPVFFCPLFLLTAVTLLSFTTVAAEKEPGSGKTELILSAITGTTSKPDTVFLSGRNRSAIATFKIEGEGKNAFMVISSVTKRKAETGVVVVFKPDSGLIGIVRARLVALNARGGVVREVPLTGLSSKGLEGENEPPLSRVFDALGYRIDPGWTSLANHCKPQRQGEEIAGGMFRKAGPGRVMITAVARYSPDFELPFGYYTNENGAPEKHLVGALVQAGSFPEHQTLFPRVSGSTSFDPQDAKFGFFVSGDDHDAYSEDLWNMVYHKKNVPHATRIYKATDGDSKVIANTYLVCFEEASNGDYNDYVFLVENVIPVEAAFIPLFNGKDLDGWNMYLDQTGQTDPEQNFRIDDEALHVSGRQAGYVITKETYTNYHLKVDFKWGQKRWPPRENTKRDAGVCYHIAPDAPDKIWQQSIEYQVQEGDAGDFWLIGNTTIEVNGKANEPQDYARIPKMKDAEYPPGSWNTLEIISFDGKCIHVLNGEVVNYGENASVSSGRILLQSEFAEVFYKNVMIRELSD